MSVPEAIIKETRTDETRAKRLKGRYELALIMDLADGTALDESRSLPLLRGPWPGVTVGLVGV